MNTIYVIMAKDRKYAEQIVYKGDDEFKKNVIEYLQNITFNTEHMEKTCWYCEVECEHSIRYNGMDIDRKTEKIIILDDIPLKTLMEWSLEVGKEDNDDWYWRSITKITGNNMSIEQI